MMTRIARAWKRRIWLSVLRKIHPIVKVSTRQGRLSVDVRDSVVGRLLYVEGEYEPGFERLLRSMDLHGMICLDVGANIGLHTINLSHAVGDKGKVIAFEPAPNNFTLLKQNIRENGCRNVFCKEVAVGNTLGECQLALHPSNFGDHRIALGADHPASIKVPLTTIDNVLKDALSGSVGLIKIDVQGFEVQVLEGMKETLKRNPGVMLLVEVFPEGLVQAGHSAGVLVDRLRSLGFVGWELHEHRLIPLLESSAYNLIGGGKYVDLFLARDQSRLDRVLSKALAGFQHLSARSSVA